MEGFNANEKQESEQTGKREEKKKKKIGQTRGHLIRWEGRKGHVFGANSPLLQAGPDKI